MKKGIFIHPRARRDRREKYYFNSAHSAFSAVKIFCLVLILYASICSASMVIYFKDGTSREVHKITFNGSSAELFLTDGSVINIPVDKIDLPSSGIGAPVGTYGTSQVTGKRTLSTKKGVFGDPLKQKRLKEEWDDSERVATVTKTIGPLQRGDTVKIVGETTPNSRPSEDDYYDQTDLVYDPEHGGYTFKQTDLDHAFVIVYKNSDGSYGKRLFDAATFSSHFTVAQAPKPAAPMPEYPIIPDKKNPDVRETSPFSTKLQKQEPEPAPLPDSSIQDQTGAEQQPTSGENTAESQERHISSRRRTWIAFSIFLLVVAGLGAGAWFLIVRSQKPYIDTSKFKRYEDDLREFEIAIWLRNGKTADQLMEICLKKFYQDHPAVLSVCNKMLKGSQKGLMAPVIAKQTGKSMTDAEEIYNQIHHQIERIRMLIQEVSQRTGIAPAKPAAEVTQKTTPSAAPSPAAAAPQKPQPPIGRQAAPSVGHVTSSVPLNASPAPEKQSKVHLIEPDRPMRSGTDLPGYANSVLNQISFLSSSEDK
jgi:hypothetical protein